MDFEDISEELKEKARACKSPEEILKLASEEGYELSDEEITAISGGGGWVCAFFTCDAKDCPEVCSVGSTRRPKLKPTSPDSNTIGLM